MPDQLCCCNRHFLTQQHSTFVSHGIPACTYDCYVRAEKRYEERRPIVERFVRQEEAARITTCADDRTPSTIYAGEHNNELED